MIIVVLISQKISFASCTSWGSSIPRSPCCLLCSGILVLSRNDQSNSISAIEQHARSLLFFRAISYVSGCLPCPFHTLRGMTNTTLLPAPHPVPYIPGFELQWFYSLIRNQNTCYLWRRVLCRNLVLLLSFPNRPLIIHSLSTVYFLMWACDNGRPAAASAGLLHVSSSLVGRYFEQNFHRSSIGKNL